MASKLNARCLVSVFVPSQGVFVFVWCHDDGELDRNHRLCYGISSSPTEFNPAQGTFIIVPAGNSWRYVYGVPEVLSENRGSLKLRIHDLTGALGYPRQNDTDPNNPAGVNIAGKVLEDGVPYSGEYLEGSFLQTDSQNGTVLWVQKEQNYLHASRSPVLEITDILSVSSPPATDSDHGYAAPSGAIAVEYDRDWTGRILTHPNGTPKIRKIDDAGPNVAQNFKIGYVALKFQRDYFGIGIHGWIGSSEESGCEFWNPTLSGTSLTVSPGKITDIMPSNMFDTFTVSVATNITNFLVATCTTDGSTITSALLGVESSPPTPPTATMGTGPITFKVLVAVTRNGRAYKMVPCEPIYQLYEVLQTEKEEPTPGSSAYDKWYNWLPQGSFV